MGEEARFKQAGLLPDSGKSARSVSMSASAVSGRSRSGRTKSWAPMSRSGRSRSRSRSGCFRPSQSGTKSWAPVSRTRASSHVAIPVKPDPIAADAPAQKSKCCWCTIIWIILAIIAGAIIAYFLLRKNGPTVRTVNGKGVSFKVGSGLKGAKNMPPDAAYGQIFSYLYDQIEYTPDLPGYPKLSSKRKNDLKASFKKLHEILVRNAENGGMPEKLFISLYFDELYGDELDNGKNSLPSTLEKREDALKRQKNGGKPDKPFILGYCTRFHAGTVEYSGKSWMFQGCPETKLLKIAQVLAN